MIIEISFVSYDYFAYLNKLNLNILIFLIKIWYMMMKRYCCNMNWYFSNFFNLIFGKSPSDINHLCSLKMLKEMQKIPSKHVLQYQREKQNVNFICKSFSFKLLYYDKNVKRCVYYVFCHAFFLLDTPTVDNTSWQESEKMLLKETDG